MPTFDYSCPGCKFRTEVLHGMNEKKSIVCTQCNKFSMIKGIGGGLAVHFKGSGFYETDYKSK